VKVKPVVTNIVMGLLEKRSAPEAVTALAARGVRATAMDARTLRLTTHHDVSRTDCEQAARLLGEALEPTAGPRVS
jgi:threonine aldolase